jgi:hypothetical protein
MGKGKARLALIAPCLALAGGCALSPGASAPARVAPPACGSCHQGEQRAWLASRHAHAADNEIFQADFARTPRAWCLRCHAPGADVARVRRGRVDERHGVGCTTCHVDDDGVVLSARVVTPAGREAHAMRAEPRLRSAAFCGDCHQFRAPRPGGVSAGSVPMQDTLREWEGTPAAARGLTCQGCHMPGGDHRAPGAHAPDALRAAVSFEVTRAGPDRVRVRASTRAVAHRFPTGDVTRSVRVQVCADEPCARVLGAVELRRSFERRGDDWALVADTTIPPPTGDGPAERVLEIALPGAAPGPLFWRATLRYAPQLEGTIPRERLEATLATGRVEAG